MERIILVDTSGSMVEEGKKSVVRYLLYAIEGLLHNEWSGNAYKIYLCNNDVKEYDIKVDFTGKASAEKLGHFLEDKRDSVVLLLSDGGYSEEVKTVFKKSGVKLLALMVGCDCNKAVLQKMAGVENLYESTDLATCMNRFMSIV